MRHLTARRDGPWLVPKRLEVRLNLGTLTLDFTEAVLSWPSLEIDADIQTGSLILVTGPGIFVSTDDLAIQTSTVKLAAPGPEIPVRFRIDTRGGPGPAPSRRGRRARHAGRAARCGSGCCGGPGGAPSPPGR